MLRRHALLIVCLCLAAIFVPTVGFIVFNIVRLADAEAVASNFVHQAIAEGRAMQMPSIAPRAGPIFAEEKTKHMLDEARQIGPLIGVQAARCVVLTDSNKLCDGQIFACIIQGVGRNGTFQSDIAMCRGGDLAPYELAGSRWQFRFLHGDPMTLNDKSPI